MTSSNAQVYGELVKRMIAFRGSLKIMQTIDEEHDLFPTIQALDTAVDTLLPISSELYPYDEKGKVAE